MRTARLLLLIAAVLVGACGQKGPLYLPDQPADAPATAAADARPKPADPQRDPARPP